MLGIGLALGATGHPVGLVFIVPAAPASCLIGWLLARRLAARLEP